MARKIVEYRCLVISPGDVFAERDAVAEVVDNWNAQLGAALDARVDLVRFDPSAIRCCPRERAAAGAPERLARRYRPACVIDAVCPAMVTRVDRCSPVFTGMKSST